MTLACFAIAILVLLAGCASVGAGDTGNGTENKPASNASIGTANNSKMEKSGITGRIMIVASGCGTVPADNPVCNAPDEITPYQGNVTIARTGKPEEAIAVDTDQAGNFSATLAPGEYGIMVENVQVGKAVVNEGSYTAFSANYTVYRP